MARRVLVASGVEEERFELIHADVASPETRLPENCRAVIAAGLLEHIECPETFLVRAAKLLEPDTGRIFVMTPTNIAHPDHLILFRDVSEIKALFAPAGLTVVNEQIIPVSENGGETSYLSILRRS